MKKHSLVRLDKNPFNKTAALKLFTLIRNEKLRLPYFIEYYQKLGIDEFYIVDNGSTDGTVQYLRSLKLKNIHYFSYKGGYQYFVHNQYESFIKKYGNDSWCLCVDPDEIFSYPFYYLIDIHTLIKYLDSRKYTSMSAFLLDMYSSKPISETVYRSGQNPLEVCSYFDSDTHYLMGYQDRFTQDFYGGVRKRVFGLDKVSVSKSPLIKMSEKIGHLEGFHHLSGVSKAPMRGVLFHFKFLNTFTHTAPEEAKRGEHWNNAIEYKQYVKKNLNKLNLFHSGHSKKFSGLYQLWKYGIVRVSLDFLLFVLIYYMRNPPHSSKITFQKRSSLS